jgi:glucose/arabinose dehydrogenase
MGWGTRKMAGLSQRLARGFVTPRHAPPLDSGRPHLSPALGAIAVLLLALGATVAQAAAPALGLRLVASGLNEPLGITHAGDRSGRLFVVEKAGRVRIVRNGIVAAQPFLDISARVGTSGERGLLGLVFHPRYATNGRFFVFYAARADGALTVSALRVSASDPDRADAASEQVLLTVPHPGADNDNGGHLAFGPDGFLYIGTGDGGGGGDPGNNAQNLGSRLGKLLRIDIDAPSGYAIPATNPFAGSAAPEIWAYGLRNPWRFTFDRATGDLYIGDVGQNRFEEVDFQPGGAAGGRNYGWRVLEGVACFSPETGCSLPGHVPPVLTYGRDQGQSITGGYVYRGLRSRALQGWYVYGDFASNRVWAARREGATWVNELAIPAPNVLNGISTFGEDEAGELYVASIGSGRIYAIDGPATGRLEAGVATGLWWNPAESGQGVQFTQRGDAIFATLYTYGADGNPKWYVASNCARVADAAPLRCRGAMEEASGPRFFGAAFDPSAVRFSTVGAIDVTFHDAGHATMTFNVGAVARTVELQRQVFRAPVAPEADLTDLYNNVDEPGWGLSVSHQGDLMFLTWYVYDDAGRPVWYVASSCGVNLEGGTCTGALFRVTGPPLAATFDASRVVATPVGSVVLAWLGPDFVSLEWTIGGVAGSKRLARQRF